MLRMKGRRHHLIILPAGTKPLRGVPNGFGRAGGSAPDTRVTGSNVPRSAGAVTNKIR